MLLSIHEFKLPEFTRSKYKYDKLNNTDCRWVYPENESSRVSHCNTLCENVVLLSQFVVHIYPQNRDDNQILVPDIFQLFNLYISL